MADELTFREALIKSDVNGHNVQSSDLKNFYGKNIACFKFFDEVPSLDLVSMPNSIKFAKNNFVIDNDTLDLCKFIINDFSKNHPNVNIKRYFYGSYFVFVSEFPITDNIINGILFYSDPLAWPGQLRVVAKAKQQKIGDVYILPVIMYMISVNEGLFESKSFEAAPDITNLHIKSERFGPGVAFNSNGKEYRIVSGLYTAQELLEKLKTFVDKGLGGRLWQWVNKNAIVYWIEGKGDISYTKEA